MTQAQKFQHFRSLFYDTLFPGQTPPDSVIRAFGFGGSTVRMRGPVALSVEVCAVTLTHSFYFYEENPTFLMGYDLISAAALVIDPVNRCVWSKRSPTAVGSPSSKTDFASCETSVKGPEGAGSPKGVDNRRQWARNGPGTR